MVARKFCSQMTQKSGGTTAGAATVIRPRLDWQRPVLFVLFAMAALAAVVFGLRPYRSYLLLRSAYALSAPAGRCVPSPSRTVQGGTAVGQAGWSARLAMRKGGIETSGGIFKTMP